MAREKLQPAAAEPPAEQDFRFTEQQLCKLWSITLDTLRKWRLTGYGPIYIKVGGAVRYRPEDVRAFEQQTMYRSSGEKIEIKGGDNGEE